MATHGLWINPTPRDVTKNPLPTCMRCEMTRNRIRPATRGVESHEKRFRTVACSLCAIEITRLLLRQGATDVNTFSIGAPSVQHPDLPVMTDADLRPTIDGIDVAQLAYDLLTGALGSHRKSATQTREGLATVVALDLEQRTARELTEAELMDVDFACSLAQSREREAKRAALLETQRALHSPMMAGAR
jgi:hypothetical protein